MLYDYTSSLTEKNNKSFVDSGEDRSTVFSFTIFIVAHLIGTHIEASAFAFSFPLRFCGIQET